MAKYEELGKAIEESVRKSCEGKSVGVAFSGGMDSGLIAALASRYARSVTCYTCGTDGSFDVTAGKELAEKLGLPWVHCRISRENIEDTPTPVFWYYGLTSTRNDYLRTSVSSVGTSRPKCS